MCTCLSLPSSRNIHFCSCIKFTSFGKEQSLLCARPDESIYERLNGPAYPAPRRLCVDVGFNDEARCLPSASMMVTINKYVIHPLLVLGWSFCVSGTIERLLSNQILLNYWLSSACCSFFHSDSRMPNMSVSHHRSLKYSFSRSLTSCFIPIFSNTLAEPTFSAIQ